MPDPSDDEWEYEYDATETEIFYIPIDLSNVPSGQKLIDSERRTGHPTLLKSRLRALNAQRGQQQQDASAPAVEAAGDQDSATVGEAQIIGLHTPNPLVMYNGQLLSCQWASTIGTDLFFTKPGAGVGSEEPLRELPGVDLLAVGSAKLVARVGRLRPRDELFEGAAEEGGAAPIEVDDGDVRDSGQVVEPDPGSFLARLNEAKEKRGDETRLAVSLSGDGTRLVSKAASDAQGTTGQGTGDVEMGGT
ncbi:hypothetical protein N0V95_010124 [Ascochyta clinopodiicola]|nr:hypothetical protein N0V95_010124 [Ascochyta clinopodiicola]